VEPERDEVVEEEEFAASCAAACSHATAEAISVDPETRRG
jgi:hypothetical protein